MAQARCGGRQRLSRLALVALLVVPLPAWPAAFVVTKTADTNDGLCDADCSLREAVLAANASPGADGIEIPAGLYVLTRSGALEDAADTGDLDLTGPTTLTGAGAALSIVDGAGSDRLIDVINADVAVTGLTLRNGSALGDSGGAIAVAGGALTLDGVALEDSFADLFGGGVAAEAAGLTVVNSTLSGNTAASFGGGLYHKGFTRPLELRSSTLSGNGAARGGGIFVDLECGYLPGE
ncbi:MAG: CSLREA domain-containing protein, partial [Myxococcota bacterium]